jgi:cell division protein FtsB
MGIKTKLRQTKYKIKHDFFTSKNIVLVIAAVICLNWVWSSITTMDRNYQLQKRVDDRRRQQLVLELQTATLEYERNFHKTREYQELAARERLGLALPGEQLLSLSPNSPEARDKYRVEEAVLPATDIESKSNFVQWLDFLLGANQHKVGWD